MRVHNPIWRVSLQGEIWTQTGAQGGHCVKTKAETEVILSKPLEARTEAWNGFFPAGLRRSKPCRYLDLGFLISTTARQQISIALNHPTCGALLRRLSEWIQQMRTVSFGALYVLYHAHVLSIKKTIFFFNTNICSFPDSPGWVNCSNFWALRIFLSLQHHLPRCHVI